MSTQVELNEYRKIQDGKQTPGAKCNRCFYDIIWDNELATSLFGKNKPFEMNKQTAHQCPIDGQNNYMTRAGYTKDQQTGKVVWIGSPTTPDAKGQQQFVASTGVTSDIAAQIGGLTNSIKQLTSAYEAVVVKQNEEIAKLKTIVDEYIRHNPLESAFLELTKRMMSYLPEAELGPKTADQYKVGFESGQ